MTLFQGMQVRDWRQFASVDIDLSQQTTILTGTNGSGKTTILNALSRHFGWEGAFVSTPYISKKKSMRLWTDIYRSLSRSDIDEAQNDKFRIGAIQYANGSECVLGTSRYVSAKYQLELGPMQEVPGLYIPSHRPNAAYTPVANIPTDPVTAQQHYQQYHNLMVQAYGTGSSKNPGTIQKQSLISLALFGEGNSSVAPNREYAEAFQALQEKLRVVLPRKIGFKRIEVRMPEVVLITDSGDFALDAMSGGINAIFGIVWQIFMSGIGRQEYTIVIDEPENHLHPSMQRALLPNLAEAFPHTRFVIATHSPFIVSSFPEAAVYALVQDEDRRIRSMKLERRDISGTPNRVLREILDVDSNLPIWVEERIRNNLEQSEGQPAEARANQLMSELASLGISDSLSEFSFGDDK